MRNGRSRPVPAPALVCVYVCLVYWWVVSGPLFEVATSWFLHMTGGDALPTTSIRRNTTWTGETMHYTNTSMIYPSRFQKYEAAKIKSATWAGGSVEK